jgi:hypothetical protein
MNKQFEKELAAFHGMKYAIGVGNGTDAIWLTLMALGIGAGDEVITYPNPFFATAETIWITGATAVLVDCDPKTNQEILCHCFYSGPCGRLAENKIRIFAIAARFVTLAAIIKCLKNPKISPPAFPTVAFPARTVSLYLSREAGNLDFSPNGSRFFALGSITQERPFNAYKELTELKYDLVEQGTALEYFHATENARTQPGRDAVTVPTPRNNLFPHQIPGPPPALFRRKFFNAAMPPVIVPTQHQQHARGFRSPVRDCETGRFSFQVPLCRIGDGGDSRHCGRKMQVNGPHK